MLNHLLGDLTLVELGDLIVAELLVTVLLEYFGESTIRVTVLLEYLDHAFLHVVTFVL